MRRLKRSSWAVLLLGLVAVTTLLAFQNEAPEAMSWEKPIAPGLTYREEIDYANHRSVHALRLSMGNPVVRASTELFGRTSYEADSVTGRGPVSGMVSQDQALAGINGDFFSMANAPSGDPLGLAVRDGQILSTPSKRVAFAWGPQDAAIGAASFSGLVKTDDGVDLKIDGLNRKCPDNQITLDTPTAGLALGESPCATAILKFDNPVWAPSTVLTGTVESVSADVAQSPIAPQRAVLVARGSGAEKVAKLTPGSRVTVEIKTTGFDWTTIDNVIGGGPRLVRHGVVSVDGAEEGFGKEFYAAKHPRTAVGRTASGDLWFVAVDGRQETGDGMSLDELAHLMLKLGCVDAMNLDGGGSTTMNVLGVTVNRPSDGQERPVADGVVFLGPKPRGSADEQLKLEAPRRVKVGSKARVRVLDANGDPVPNLQVIWGCTGACAIDQGGNLRVLKPGAAKLQASVHGQLFNAKIVVDG